MLEGAVLFFGTLCGSTRPLTDHGYAWSGMVRPLVNMVNLLFEVVNLLVNFVGQRLVEPWSNLCCAGRSTRRLLTLH